MRVTVLAWLLGLLIAGLVTADDGNRTTLTRPFWGTSQSIGVGASKIVTFQIGYSEIQGLDWDIISSVGAGQPVTVQVQVRNSNSERGPFTYWTSINGTPSTTVFNLTGVSPLQGGTDLRIFPSDWVQITVVNNGPAAITVRRKSLFTF